MDNVVSFQDLVSNGEAWIGGRIDTLEEEDYTFSGVITGMSLDEDVFTVYTKCGTNIFANTKYVTFLPQVISDNVVKFQVPYIGIAYINKPNLKKQERSI